MHNRLQAVREAQGLSVTDLSRRSGVSRQTIYSIEGDREYTPLGSVMARLASALGVTIGDLFLADPAEPAQVVAS